MKEWKEVNLNEYLTINYTKSRKKEGDGYVNYINISSGFDIETSSLYYNEEKVAHMYIWAIQIGFNNDVLYGRTWEELKYLLENVKDIMGLDDKNRLIIYVHNLSYEFQFMRKHFTWGNVFAVDERKPIKALTNLGIEFRDSLILSGLNLELTAKNLIKHDIKKLKGDLDYKLIRHSKTPLTKQEFEYVENDVKIITCYIDEQLDRYEKITKIPLTNTGRVREFVKNKCLFTNSNHSKSNGKKFSDYHKLMTNLKLDVEDYKMLRNGFMGGYTHANAFKTGKLLTNVSSIDFTSSYPAVMLSETFPMSEPKDVNPKSEKEFNEYLKTHNVLFTAEFTNIEATFIYDNYISQSKCFHIENATINNGRVFNAKKIRMILTELDYEIIKNTYKWDSMKLGKVKVFKTNYLPKPIIDSVLELYQDKTELKGVEGKESEYLLSKGMLNSIYGMTVTDIIKDSTLYDSINHEWGVDEVDVFKEIDQYNNKKTRFLYYAWGVWVTAYARRNLWTGILSIGKDYVYSDTDSIKFENYDKHVDYINHYNKQLNKKLMLMAKTYSIDPKMFKPKNRQGISKPIGVWDYEGTYNHFKTLGAKRYMHSKDGDVEITIAGLSKQNGVHYLKENSESVEDVFKQFNTNMYIPKDSTGKNTHTYIDTPKQYAVKDYLGNYSEVTSQSSVHLESVEFTLSLSRQYERFLNNLIKGYTLKGDKTL